MADQTGTPQSTPSPSADTFPMVFDDGSRAMVPSAKVNDAFAAGGKLAQPMKLSDGSMSMVPFDQVHDVMAKGGTFMPSSAAGTIPKPQAAMREVDPTAGAGVPGALVRAGQTIVGAPRQAYHALADAPQNTEEAAVEAAGSSAQPGTGRLALAAKRLIYDPQRETYQQGQAMEDLANQRYGKPQGAPVGITTPVGTLPSSLATTLFGASGQPVTPIAGGRHEAALRDTAGALKMASLVPLVGPLAAHLAMAYKGDPSSETANEQTPYGTEGDPSGALTEGLAYAAEPALTEKLGALQGTGQAAFTDLSAPEMRGLQAKVENEAKRISTRKPTGPNAVADPLRNDLQINSQDIHDAGLTQSIAHLMEQYPGLRIPPGSSPEQVVAAFDQHARDNLRFMHDEFPAEWREPSAFWYDGANNLATDWARQYGLKDTQTSGVIASQSPQKDWNMNVSLAKRIIEGVKQGDDLRYTPEMANKASAMVQEKAKKDPTGAARLNTAFQDIAGKPYGDLQSVPQKAVWLRLWDEAHNDRGYDIYNPDGSIRGPAVTAEGKPAKVAWGTFPSIAKAISILEDGSRENISNQLGDAHKVRSFNNNIVAPNSPSGDVTIDTHAVAANLMRPLSGDDPEVAQNFGSFKGTSSGPHGVKGSYGFHADAYRDIAAENGILPRQEQSMTWEGARSLFPDTFKNAKNKAIIDGIWRDYSAGRISDVEARRQIVKAAGGWKPPEWAK